MSLKIVSVGKKHEDWVSAGIERYQKRLQRPFDTEWLLIGPSGFDDTSARRDESERILSKLTPTDFVILLDERGKELDSPALSQTLTYPLSHSQSVVLIIGGAYGVDESVHKRAQFVWSLSPLVFPHQLVRLLLMEQLYRAQEIANNRPYHHQ
jgi:23S rRNA (pseudouridine1915-N3)-methyltransferase